MILQFLAISCHTHDTPAVYKPVSRTLQTHCLAPSKKETYKVRPGENSAKHEIFVQHTSDIADQL